MVLPAKAAGFDLSCTLMDNLLLIAAVVFDYSST